MKRILFFAFSLVLILALDRDNALAHASLVESTPAPGETVGPNLEAIRLRFDDELAQESSLAVLGTNFQPVPGLEMQVQGETIIAQLSSPLPPDTYTVQWVAVASDGDTTQGSFQFGVQETAGIQPGLIWAGAAIAVLGLFAGFVWMRRRPRSD